MTLFQPHLGDCKRQELRNLPFWPTPLLKSQLVKDGEDFVLKKGTLKDSQGFGPYQNKPFYCTTIAYQVGLNAVLGWPQASRPTSKKNRHL